MSNWVDFTADLREPEQQLAKLIRYVNGVGEKPDALPTGLVRHHRLASLAYQNGFSEFKSDFIQHALFAELREQQLSKLLNLFKLSGVRVCLLKGISYLATLYDDPAERSMGDVDLLVEEQTFDKAQQLIKELGYVSRDLHREASQFHHAVTFDLGKFSIDLHRRIYQPGRSKISMAAVWARMKPASERNDAALRLAPTDELVFHLLHIARSEFMVSVISYVDLPRLETQSGCSRLELFQLAKTVRIQRALKAVLHMSDAIYGAPLHDLHKRRFRFCPSVKEVLGITPLSRRRQLVIKAHLSEGPREFLGLGRSYLAEQYKFWL